jgi:predicted nuclease of predicted toxin-antitoxin system
MRILVDENVPRMTVAVLKGLAHDVRDLRGTEDKGIPDDDIWALAQRESRLVVTTDKGFARYRGLVHCGVLIVALRRPNRRRIHDRVLKALASFPDERHWQHTVVIMRDRARSVWRRRADA